MRLCAAAHARACAHICVLPVKFVPCFFGMCGSGICWQWVAAQEKRAEEAESLQ